MTRRSYDQHCGLAAALDLVGERWTLLVVRELMTGPKRYSDLLDGLPGIGTSLLAERLRHLEAGGVLARRTLPPPAPATVYELSDAGEELGRALMPLVSWGLVHALSPAADRDQLARAAWSLLPFVYDLPPHALTGLDGIYDFRVGDDAARLAVAGGRARIASPDSADEPDAVFELSAGTATDIGAGRLDPARAVAAGRLRIEGDAEAAAALVAALRPADADRSA